MPPRGARPARRPGRALLRRSGSALCRCPWPECALVPAGSRFNRLLGHCPSSTSANRTRGTGRSRPCTSPASPPPPRTWGVGEVLFQSALAPKDERYAPAAVQVQLHGSSPNVSIRSRPEGREIRGAGRSGPSIRGSMRFNPLSPRRTRDTEAVEFQAIRYASMSFQSALAPKDERYEVTANAGNASKDEFQSALAPKDERYRIGAKTLAALRHGRTRVSIRSRPEGREIRGRSRRCLRDAIPTFQSALAPKDERYSGSPEGQCKCRFNPLSPRRTRDTWTD